MDVFKDLLVVLFCLLGLMKSGNYQTSKEHFLIKREVLTDLFKKSLFWDSFEREVYYKSGISLTNFHLFSSFVILLF